MRPVQARLMVDAEPVSGRTITTPWTTVYADSTSNRYFPVTRPLPMTEDFGEVRMSIEVESKGGDAAEFALGWRETDFPKDPSSWSTATDVFDKITGCAYGTTFTAMSPTDRFVQFVVGAKLAASGLGMARVRTRIDYRE